MQDVISAQDYARCFSRRGAQCISNRGCPGASDSNSIAQQLAGCCWPCMYMLWLPDVSAQRAAAAAAAWQLAGCVFCVSYVELGLCCSSRRVRLVWSCAAVALWSALECSCCSVVLPCCCVAAASESHNTLMPSSCWCASAPTVLLQLYAVITWCCCGGCCWCCAALVLFSVSNAPYMCRMCNYSL
jgi:hypothetical protein